MNAPSDSNSLAKVLSETAPKSKINRKIEIHFFTPPREILQFLSEANEAEAQATLQDLSQLPEKMLTIINNKNLPEKYKLQLKKIVLEKLEDGKLDSILAKKYTLTPTGNPELFHPFINRVKTLIDNGCLDSRIVQAIRNPLDNDTSTHLGALIHFTLSTYNDFAINRVKDASKEVSLIQDAILERLANIISISVTSNEDDSHFVESAQICSPYEYIFKNVRQEEDFGQIKCMMPPLAIQLTQSEIKAIVMSDQTIKNQKLNNICLEICKNSQEILNLTRNDELSDEKYKNINKKTRDEIDLKFLSESASCLTRYYRSQISEHTGNKKLWQSQSKEVRTRLIELVKIQVMKKHFTQDDLQLWKYHLTNAEQREVKIDKLNITIKNKKSESKETNNNRKIEPELTSKPAKDSEFRQAVYNTLSFKTHGHTKKILKEKERQVRASLFNNYNIKHESLPKPVLLASKIFVLPYLHIKASKATQKNPNITKKQNRALIREEIENSIALNDCFNPNLKEFHELDTTVVVSEKVLLLTDFLKIKRTHMV